MAFETLRQADRLDGIYGCLMVCFQIGKPTPVQPFNPPGRRYIVNRPKTNARGGVSPLKYTGFFVQHIVVVHPIQTIPTLRIDLKMISKPLQCRWLWSSKLNLVSVSRSSMSLWSSIVSMRIWSPCKNWTPPGALGRPSPRTQAPTRTVAPGTKFQGSRFTSISACALLPQDWAPGEVRIGVPVSTGSSTDDSQFV